MMWSQLWWLFNLRFQSEPSTDLHKRWEQDLSSRLTRLGKYQVNAIFPSLCIQISAFYLPPLIDCTEKLQWNQEKKRPPIVCYHPGARSKWGLGLQLWKVTGNWQIANPLRAIEANKSYISTKNGGKESTLSTAGPFGATVHYMQTCWQPGTRRLQRSQRRQGLGFGDSCVLPSEVLSECLSSIGQFSSIEKTDPRMKEVWTKSDLD